MYKAFNFKISQTEFRGKFPEYVDLTFTPSNLFTKTTMDGAVKSLWTLNADEIRKTWFSECQIDIFLSHSRKDIELAKMFGAYMQKVFGLNVFIDSEAWYHMDTMLKELDRKYCVSERNPDGTVKTYSYDNRNVTTAHVHMILSHALTKMIDNAECFIFLNTENSTTRQDESSIDTLSPWLFHELAIVEFIEEKKPQPISEGFTCDSADNRSYGPSLKYSVETKRLRSLTLDQVKLWQDHFFLRQIKKTSQPLSILYDIVDRRTRV